MEQITTVGIDLAKQPFSLHDLQRLTVWFDRQFKEWGRNDGSDKVTDVNPC